MIGEKALNWHTAKNAHSQGRSSWIGRLVKSILAKTLKLGFVAGLAAILLSGCAITKRNPSFVQQVPAVGQLQGNPKTISVFPNANAPYQMPLDESPKEQALYLYEVLKEHDYAQLEIHLRRYVPELKKIDEEDIEPLDDIVTLAVTATNPEVSEAFDLMIKGGRRGWGSFNTELQILFWLAEQNEFKKDDTLAQALAMVNGLWVSMGTDEVREAVHKDTNDLLNYFRETDEWQKAVGHHCLEDYPLEAKVALAWTANDTGTHGPHALSGLQRKSKSRTFGLKDYSWNTVSVNTLQEMKSHAIEKGWSNNNVGTVSENLEEYFSFSGTGRHWKYVYSWNEKLEIDGEVVSARNMNNADFEYGHYVEYGHGIGVCEDRMALTDAFLKSLGIPSLALLTYWNEGSSFGGHTNTVYYDPQTNLWKGYYRQLRLDSIKNPIDFYIFKPPVKQPGYVPKKRNGIVPAPRNACVPSSYRNGETNTSMFYPIFNTTQQNKTAMFTTGVKTDQIKKWLLR